MQKSNPKLLNKLPLFGPEGDVVTNGIASPRHMITDGEFKEHGQPIPSELRPLPSLLVEEVQTAVATDPKTADLVKQYQIDLEKIDQQLLELGPYAQDAYVEDSPKDTDHSSVGPPAELRRGKRGKPATQGKLARRSSRVADDPSEQQRGWREVMEARQEEKEMPKKKWRKVGSAGPVVRGKEGQLDAQSDPLNVSSAGIIPPASEIEMRALYLPGQSDFGPSEDSKQGSPASKAERERGECHPPSTGTQRTSTPGSDIQSHPGVEESQVHVSTQPSRLTSTSVATTAHSTPDCNTSSPSDAPSYSRAQPSAQWQPIPAKLPPASRHHDPSHLLMAALAHRPQQVSMESAGASEEVDVTRVENTESQSHQLTAAEAERIGLLSSELQARQEAYASPNHPHLRKELRTDSPSSLAEALSSGLESRQMSTPSPGAAHHGHRSSEIAEPHSLAQHPPSVPRQPGFSIAQLTRTPEYSAVQSPAQDVRSSLESGRGGNIQVSGDRSTGSPYGELETSLIRKRRSSSTSSHRSVKQHSFDDNASARSGSPLSVPTPRGQLMPVVMRGEWGEGGAATPPPTSHESKPPILQSSAGAFPMWPGMTPVPTDGSLPGQVQRYPLPTPFLSASHPWLRGGMLPGLPFRPALYPAAAATPLDPNNPYKPMLGLPYYPFTPAGLKSPFPTPAFSSPGSANGSQPQTPSSVVSTPGFTFGQYPLTAGPSVGALRGVNEVQSRLPVGTPPLVQHPLTGGKDSKQTSASPEAPQEVQQPPWPLLPGMQLLQTPFGFGVQSPLVSSVSQSSLLNSRGAMPLSSSPLTLAAQSLVSVPTADNQLPEAHHQIRDSLSGKRLKKQSGSTIDLTAREPVIKHIEAPSPQEAVKMAAQRMSPFHEQSRDSPKWRGVQEAAQVPPASSTFMPAFINNLSSSAGSSSQAQGPVLPYPVFSASGAGATPMNLPGHLINPSQLVGVALPGGHMIPMGYTQALSSLGGKAEEGGGKKRSPKGSGGQKLRIHQMDFKNQGKVDRRRRRPWRTAEKDRKEEEISTAAPKAKPVGVPSTRATEPPTSSASEDNYALNMLADCSSKEGEKSKLVEEMSTSQQKQEMVAKRALMRSPGSLAGANSLLLLAKPDSASPPVSQPLKVAPPETAVVDGLLRLSNSSVPISSAPTASSASQVSAAQDKPTTQDGRVPVSESQSRLSSMSAAEAMLMIGQKAEESKKDGAFSGEEAETAFDTNVSEKDQASAERRKSEVDSENTDTDSEATLSPTSPSPPADARWSQGPLNPQVEASTPQELPASTPNPPEMVETMLQGSLSSCLMPSNHDTKSLPVSASEVIAAPQTTQEKTQEEAGSPPSPNKDIHHPCGQSGKPTLKYAEEECSMDPGSSKFGVRGCVEEERTGKEEKPLSDDVTSFPSTPAPVQDEGSCGVDVEKVDAVSADRLEPCNGATVMAASPKQKEKVLEKPPSVGESPPATEGDAEPTVPTPRLSPTTSAHLESCEHEEREEPPCQPVAEEQSESLLGADTPPPAKRPRVEETADNVLEEVMEAEPQVTPPSPSCGTAVEPAIPEPLTTASPNLPSTDTSAESLSSGPQLLHTSSPVKPEKVDKQGSPGSVQESDKDGSFGSFAKSYPLEPLSPVEFTDKELISHSLKGGETQLQDEPTPKDAEEEVTEQDGGQCGVRASAPVQEDSEEDLHPEPAYTVSHDVTGSGAREESTCISWPPDPNDVTMAAEGEIPLSQKGSTPVSVTVSKSGASPTHSSDIEEVPASSEAVEQPAACAVPPKSASLTSSEKRSSPPKVDQRSPKSAAESSTGAVPSTSLRKSSPPVAPQNRLPVGKPGLDRLQHRKALSQHSQKQHSRDEKTMPAKKWSRPPETASRSWNLFEVDPQEGRRQKTEHRAGERDREQSTHSEGKKTKSPSRPPLPSHSHLSHTGNRQSVEKAKHGSRSPRSFGSDESSHRHNRAQEGRGHVWESREMGKQKGWQSGRQGSRFSPLPSSHVDHSPGHFRDKEEASSMSDEDQGRAGRARAHQNSHSWREDHQSQADHGRDRGKHKSIHRGDSKQSSDHGGRKIVRAEKEKSHGSADQRKLPLSSAEPNHEEGGGGGGGFGRHREDDDEHSTSRLKVAGARKRSYESVSDDELPEDSTRSSSRESSLVREDRDRSERRSSLEAAAELRSSQWWKERRSAGLSDDGEEYSRTSKHKKHKHSKEHKEHKERRKWRKTDGNDHKAKRSSEDKPWHSYHKH